VTALVVGLVGLQAWAVISYTDDWPLGSNAMFAFRREPSQDVFDLAIDVEVAGEWRRLDPATDLGVIDVEAFRRQLFAQWYGSSDPSFPQGSVGRDDPARFVARMTTLCREVAGALSRRGRASDAMALSVERLTRRSDTWVVTETRKVGDCTPLTGTFALANR
jgi:hypothetical protein